MGTPVQMIEREMQCVGAGECISRPMTEEERFKYFGEKREVDEVRGVKITPPEKEKLIEALAQAQGKTKAIYHAAKVYVVSSSTIQNWIKNYGIQFDESGQVIQEPAIPESEEVEKIAELENAFQEITKLDIPVPEIKIDDDSEIEKLAEALKQNEPSEIQTLEQATKEAIARIGYRVGYAEYDITENFSVTVDFRQKLVSINDCKEFTFEEAEAAADLLTNIL